MTTMQESLADRDFQRRLTGADVRLGEVWPQYVTPHQFVSWPGHAACAWCGGTRNHTRHIS